MRLRWLQHIGMCLMGLALVACGTENLSDGLEEKEKMEVPLLFELRQQGAEGDLSYADTLKPNPREIFVDKVLVTIYRRDELGSYESDLEGFVRDQQLLLVAQEEGTPEKQPRYVARGVVQLSSGFAYRMTAIAYSEQKGEQALFQLNEPLLSYAEVELTDAKQDYKTPELFFGNVVHLDRDTIFTYDKVKEGKMNLTGWLYRGVAGVELTLAKVASEVKRIDLLADSIHTRVRSRLFEDFSHPYAMQRDGTYQHFLLNSWTRPEGTTEPVDVSLVGANLLEVCTSLSLRMTLAGKEGTDQTVVCRLRVRKGEPARLAAPFTRSLPGDGGHGTGIIPGKPTYPEQPEDPDLPAQKDPYKICFKRNHYYRMKGDYDRLTTMGYILQVTVNPNWEGSVNLPLDRP